MSNPTPITPRSVHEVSGWDAEADVVIVGFGCAGASAAIEAADAGADVFIVERMGGAGGVSAMAGGLVYLGGGTPIQKACGFDDTPDEMFKCLMAACGPDPDEAKISI
jgi:3-oxo-5alpha-steroid 4-dehydrogenase